MHEDLRELPTGHSWRFVKHGRESSRVRLRLVGEGMRRRLLQVHGSPAKYGWQTISHIRRPLAWPMLDDLLDDLLDVFQRLSGPFTAQ